MKFLMDESCADSPIDYFSYRSTTRQGITCCVFSQCGKYFGFVVNQSNVWIHETSQLLSYAREPLHQGDFTTSTVDMWKFNERPIGPILPLHIIGANLGATINFVAFGEGNMAKCRLPRRLPKRRSSVTKDPNRVSVVAVAQTDGFIDVYNFNLLGDSYSPTLAKMVLFDGRQSIEHLAISTDGSLRLASVSCQGVVKLWDIWDDGNMYVTLTSPDSPTTISSVASKTVRPPYNHHVKVTAWHPFEGHLFLGDERGLGLILESESPYRCLHLVRHYHAISGAAFSSDGAFLLTASYDGSCTFWAAPSYVSISQYWHTPVPRNISLLGGANDFHVSCLALSPTSRGFATCCEDGRFRLWSFATNSEPRVLNTSAINRGLFNGRSIVFSPCGHFLACSYGDTRLRVFFFPKKDDSLLFQCARAVRRSMVSTLFAEQASNKGSVSTPDANKGPINVIRALSSLNIPPYLRVALCYGIHSANAAF